MTKKAFTLIELLLAIGIIGVLAAIVIIAINPTQQLTNAEDARRRAFERELQSAMMQYVVDNSQLPVSIPTGSSNAVEICAAGATASGCVNLDVLTQNGEYLVELERDASESNTDYLGYTVYQSAGGFVTVNATYMGSSPGGSTGGSTGGDTGGGDSSSSSTSSTTACNDVTIVNQGSGNDIGTVLDDDILVIVLNSNSTPSGFTDIAYINESFARARMSYKTLTSADSNSSPGTVSYWYVLRNVDISSVATASAIDVDDILYIPDLTLPDNTSDGVVIGFCDSYQGAGGNFGYADMSSWTIDRFEQFGEQEVTVSTNLSMDGSTQNWGNARCYLTEDDGAENLAMVVAGFPGTCSSSSSSSSSTSSSASAPPLWGSVSAQFDGGNVTNITVNTPSSTAEGDLLIATVMNGTAGATLSDPGGWTSFESAALGYPGKSELFYKIASDSEPASYTFTSSVANDMGAVVIRYDDADTSNPIHASVSEAQPQFSSNLAPSIGTTVDFTKIVYVIVADIIDSDGVYDVTPSGTTQRYYSQNPTDDFGIMIVDKDLNTAGTSGTAQFANGANYRAHVYTIAILPEGGVDVTNPTTTTLSPADDATDVAIDTNLVLTFSEPVDLESGNVTIHQASDDSIVATIDVTSGLVTGGGTNTITINPSTNLASNTEYYVLVPSTAIDDTGGNSYGGISSTTSWSFTTADDPSGTFTGTVDNSSTDIVEYRNFGSIIGWFHDWVENDGPNGIWVRFENVTIPQGSTITTAEVEFTVRSNGCNQTFNLTARAEDVDDGSELTSNPSGLVMTTASTITNIAAPATGTQDQIDVASSLQEVVSRTGFSSGNAVVFRFDASSTPSWIDCYPINWELNVDYTN